MVQYIMISWYKRGNISECWYYISPSTIANLDATNLLQIHDLPKQKESPIELNDHSNDGPTNEDQKNTACEKSSSFQLVRLEEESVRAASSNDEDDTCKKEDLSPPTQELVKHNIMQCVCMYIYSSITLKLFCCVMVHVHLYIIYLTYNVHVRTCTCIGSNSCIIIHFTTTSCTHIPVLYIHVHVHISRNVVSCKDLHCPLPVVPCQRRELLQERGNPVQTPPSPAQFLHERDKIHFINLSPQVLKLQECPFHTPTIM